jgi:hypothetical protein
MKRKETLEELVEKVRKLPPMTHKERRLQALDFAYGNLACSTNHKPARKAFEWLFINEGFTVEEFNAWAKDKEWTR